MNGTRLIVTHPGMAHRDDLLAVAFALTANPDATVERRDPTPEEIEDATVLVLDIGGEYDASVRTYDHHQLPRDAEATCALHMFVDAELDAEAREGLKLQDWYQFTAIVDSKGPFAAAKEYGWSEFPWATLSPVEKELLGWFQRESTVKPGSFLSEALRSLGMAILQSARELTAKVRFARAALEVVEVSGVKVLVADALTDSAAMGMVQKSDHPDAGVLVTHDDRGNGWTLYRYNDHPSVDFSVLRGRDSILFSHPGGFIAKTRERCAKEVALALVADAIS